MSKRHSKRTRFRGYPPFLLHLRHGGGVKFEGGYLLTPHVVSRAAHERRVLHAASARVGDAAIGVDLHAGERAAQARNVENALAGDEISAEIAPMLRARIGVLRVLYPACGSGVFLVHALEALAALQCRAGDTRPVALLRRELLTRSIFGVDVNPTAVWLCEPCSGYWW